MEKYVEYAPWLIVVLLFLWQNKVFVTPELLEKRFTEFEHSIEGKFVLQQTHNIAISELKSDVSEIKDKIDKMYDMMIKG